MAMTNPDNSKIALEVTGQGTETRLKVELDTGSGWVEVASNLTPTLYLNTGPAGLHSYAFQNVTDFYDDWAAYELEPEAGIPPDATKLAAWWTLDGTLNDAHNANHLSYYTGTTGPNYTTGLTGQCIDLESADTQHMSAVASSDFIRGGTNPITLNIWHKPETRPSGAGLMGQELEVVLRIGTTRNIEAILNSFTTNDRTTSAADTLLLDTWQMFSFVYDGTDIRCYTNGVSSGTAVVPTGSWANISNFIRIGSVAGGSTCDGLVEDATWWNAALTPAQLRWLYNSGKSRSYAELPV